MCASTHTYIYMTLKYRRNIVMATVSEHIATIRMKTLQEHFDNAPEIAEVSMYACMYVCICKTLQEHFDNAPEMAEVSMYVCMYV